MKTLINLFKYNVFFLLYINIDFFSIYSKSKKKIFVLCMKIAPNFMLIELLEFQILKHFDL